MLVSWRVAVIAQRVLDASAIGGGQDGESEALQGQGAEKGGIFALPSKEKAGQQGPQTKKRRDPLCVPSLPAHTPCSVSPLAPCPTRPPRSSSLAPSALQGTRGKWDWDGGDSCGTEVASWLGRKGTHS